MANMLKREKQRRRREDASGVKTVSLGKKLISALLVVTMSFMSYSPSIALAADQSSNASDAIRAAADETEATSYPTDTEQADDPEEVIPSEDPEVNPEDQPGEPEESASQESADPEASQASSSSSAAASSEAAQPAEDTPKTIEATLASASGGHYTVKVKYDKAAAIPDGSTVQIVEYTQEPSDPNWRNDPAYNGRPHENERMVSADYLTQRAAVTVKGLGMPDDSLVFFAKFLDVAIVHDGQAVQPQTPVEVTIETTAVDITCSDAIELARMVYDENLANNPQAVQDGFVAGDGKSAQSLHAANLTYDKNAETNRSAADDKVVKLQYSSNEFGEIAIEGIAVPKAPLWRDERGTADVLGPASLNVDPNPVDAAGIKEGDQLLGAFTFGTSPARDYGTTLWVRASAPEGENANPEQPAAGKIVGYQMQGGAIAGDAVALTPSGSASFKATDGVAIVRESTPEQSTNVPVVENVSAASAGPVNVIERQLPASNGGKYIVKVSYGPESGVPEGASLQVRELTGAALQQHRAQAVEALGDEEVTSVRALDIEILDEMGNKVEPTGDVNVSITLADAVVSGAPQIVHFGDEGPEVIDPQQTVTPSGKGSMSGSRTLDFAADSFSVYAVVFIVKELELTASDGASYKVTVAYDASSDIPGNAQLVVREITAADEGYEDYIARSAAALGENPEAIVLARAFDISLRNPQTGEEYQPSKNVQVSIELLNDNLGNYPDVDVVHIHGAANEQVNTLPSTVEGNALAFSADGFSVYVLAGFDPQFGQPRRTYNFYIWSDENNRWDPYLFTTENGDATASQTVLNGETPMVPSPIAGNKQFAGWYAYKDGGTEFEPTAYDFNAPVTQDEVIDLYALFKDYAPVVFHDQYSNDMQDFPIAATRRAELVGNPAKGTVKISDVKSTYSGGSDMAFYGWSRTKILDPASGKDIDGNPIQPIVPDENGCIEVTGETHLYPIFKSVEWLSYWSGPTGSGATYYPAQMCFDGAGPESLPKPTRSGYTFDGWYAGSLGEDGQPVYGNIALSDGEGNLINNASDGGASVYDNALHLTQDVTLYAKWVGHEVANYKVIVWKQKASATAATEDEYKYDFVESSIETAAIGSSATIPDAFKNYATTDPAFSGYVCRVDPKDGEEVSDQGYTVLNVWYDRAGDYAPTGLGHKITFVDAAGSGVYADYDDIAYQTSLLTGNNGASFVPGDPTKANYSFTGWFADANCTTQVFFSKEDLDAYTGYNQTVLYDEMPDGDLTLYAGWEAEWYVVQIDPNYGTFNGTGSTWFWKTVESDLVQEYTQVTRDYVESSSGTYYYVKHDRAYYGYTGNEWDNSEPDRDAYYTEQPGEATEYKTFERMPGIYSYAGWYEVHADGTETPYDFNQHVTHDTLIKLHWKKAGTYYVKYDAGEGTMDNGDDEAADTNVYGDNAEVLITHSAVAPEGYSFVGWRVQGNASSAFYGLGQSFILQSDYAVSISGKETVTLEAVYTKLDTATLTYDFNGGTADPAAFDFGLQVDTSAPAQVNHPLAAGDTTAVVSNLVNNGEFRISSGTGLSRGNAELMGWSVNPTYNPEKDTLFTLGGTYGVNDVGSTTLYAVWKDKVTYHLNKTTGADWGGTWDPSIYTLEGDTYTQTVYVGGTISEPTYIPTYTPPTGSTDTNTMFRYWVDSPTGSQAHDFSQQVTGALDLYAYWSGPIEVPVHAVDASQPQLQEKTSTDGWSINAIEAGADPVNVLEPYYAMPPAGSKHTLAFVAAHDRRSDIQTISEDEAIRSIYYDQRAKHLYVKFNDTSKTDAALDENYDIYYVYYEEKTREIAYVSMDAQGALTPVTTIGNPPQATPLLGTCEMDSQIADPLSYTIGYGNYAFAMGDASASNAAGLRVITEASDASHRVPTLNVRNTWRGFQCTTETDNNATWIDCGYDPKLYVVYYSQQPTVIRFQELTKGTSEKMGQEFAYNVVVTQKNSDGSESEITPSGGSSFVLKSGEAQSAVLFHSNTYDQKVTITQSYIPATDTSFDTSIESADGTVSGSYSWSYETTAESSGTKLVTFTNTNKSTTVEVHVARIENGNIVLRDDLRNTLDLSTYTFEQPIKTDSTVPDAKLLESLPASNVYNDAYGVYAFGAVVYGTDDGNKVTIGEMGVDSIAYAQVKDNHYELQISDATGESMGELGTNKLYYLYYPMPEIQYVKQMGQGNNAPLTLIRGSLDGINPSDTITYGGLPLNMNGLEVVQDQCITVPLEGLTISQSAGNALFNMPPILDDETYQRYLSYTSIGVGPEVSPEHPRTIADLGGNVSDDLEMQLKIQDNALSWSFDGASWHPMDESQTIYVIYTERGYDLQVSKVVDMSESGNNPIFTDRAFKVTISSSAITKNSYKAEGADATTVSAVPAEGGLPGSIELTVRDGSKIKLIGLGRGRYTFTETNNQNYSVSAISGSIMGDDSTDVLPDPYGNFNLDLNSEKRFVLTNSPKAICKIVQDDGEHLFYTLNDAIEYVMASIESHEATIELLTDYLMPQADILTIPAGADITLTTATGSGTVYDGTGIAAINRSSGLSGDSMIVNNGTLTLAEVTIDGKSVSSSAPMIQSAGTLYVRHGTTLTNAVNSGNGGAISSTGMVSILDNDRVNLSNNQAANGGLIYYAGSGVVAVSGGTISGNRATGSTDDEDNPVVAKGGAIYAETGEVALSGGTISGNVATSGFGGAIYSANAYIVVNGSGSGATLSGNSAANGGAVYVDTGTFEQTNGTITGNSAAGGLTDDEGNQLPGKGGAIYVASASGEATISGGKLTGNKAGLGTNPAGGFGGALYAENGTVNVSGGTIGGTNGPANEAANGSAVFVEFGTANISGGTITNNTASDNGGAVGAGDGAARLSFSGSPVITGNSKNVYLDVDSASVIDTNGLGANANIGIYVPDGTLFTNRGDVGARFGSFANAGDRVTGFHNDRRPNLDPVKDSDTRKIYWSKPVQVQIRKIDNYFPADFTPGTSGTKVYPSSGNFASYNPQNSDASISAIADDLYTANKSALGTKTYAAAYLVNGDQPEYLVRLVWAIDTENDGQWKWMVQKLDGSTEPLGNRNIVIYYAESTYLSIENNADYALNIDTLNIIGQSVTAANPVPGLVFAKNGAIQPELVPVTQADLQLALDGGSINILLPGGYKRAYTLEGNFNTAEGTDVKLRKTGEDPTTIRSNQRVSFGGTTLDKGKTYEIIFGEDRDICKIGNERFSTFYAAIDYAKRNNMSEVKIEMLVDYLEPKGDVLKVLESDGIKKLELTTAPEYGTGNATISRGGDNDVDPLVTVTGNDYAVGMEAYIHDLNFDGKSLKGKCDGGAFKTKNCKVTFERSTCKNFVANNGGAIFVSFGKEKSVANNAIGYDFTNFSDGGNYYADASFTVSYVNFSNCESQSTFQRSGGGAVWTNAKSLTMSNCTFSNCSALYNAQNQGGAVFHRIDSPDQTTYPTQPYCGRSAAYPNDPGSITTMNDCSFTSCVAMAGGGMETDAHNVYINRCDFTACSTKQKDGGGVNIYIYERQGGQWQSNNLPSEAHFDTCTFTACASSARNAGAVRSLAMDTEFTNCRFMNNTAALQAGAIYVDNRVANSTVIHGCTFEGCIANAGSGGAIHTAALTLTVDQNTKISNCKANGTGGSQGNGGAINHVLPSEKAGSFTLIEDSVISGCTAAKGGGGYFTDKMVGGVTFINSTVENCTANSTNGGGICNSVSAPLTLINTTVSGNKVNSSTGLGGGVYCKKNMVLQNSYIRNNTAQTTNANATNAAGVYLAETSGTLTIGDAAYMYDDNYRDNSTIENNTTKNGAYSNLRLPESNGVNVNTVRVNCNLGPKNGVGGHIGVVNAKKVGTRFGTSNREDGVAPVGFSDASYVFKSDSSTVHGIVSRQDDTRKQIIWAGPPACKITDESGALLYFGKNGNDPAIFDVLDNGANNGKTSAFSMLRQPPKLYYAPATEGGIGQEYTGSFFSVRMLVENYELTNQITMVDNANRTIELTTAGKADTDGYPFEKTATGKRATITRGSGVTGSMAITRANVRLNNVVLDGNGATSTQDGAILQVAGTKATKVELLSDAVLQYGKAANGGAVAVTNGTFEIRGGLVRFCEATANGGGVYAASTANTAASGGFSLALGDIQQCRAVDGAGVYVQDGVFSMSNGNIGGCTASGNGGGVFVADGKTMNMSGGSIGDKLPNSATLSGGGIAVGGASSKLNFSRQVNVSRNTCQASEATGKICNVELNQDTQDVINVSSALYNRAYIGVYVPGNRDDENPGNDTPPYSTRGGELDAFGSFVSGEASLYCFVNDRNGLKGGIIANPAPNTIYWIKIFSIEVSKSVQVSDNVPTTTKQAAMNQEFTFLVRIWDTNENVSAVKVKDITQEIAAAAAEGEESKFGAIPFTLSADENLATALVTLKSGETVTSENLPAGLGYDVTESWTTGYSNIPSSLDKTINFQGGTTGENKDNKTGINPYVSYAAFTNILPVCKITDGSGNLLYRNANISGNKTIEQTPAVYKDLNEAYAVLNAINANMGTQLFARNKNISYSGDFRIEMLVPEYTVTSTWTVSSAHAITLSTASKTASDNFPYSDSGVAEIKRGSSFVDGSMIRLTGTSNLTLENVKLNGNKVQADTEGGIVYVPLGGTLSVLSGAALQNSRTTGNGAGIYLATGGTLNLSGTPTFGGTDTNAYGYLYNETGNFKVGELKDADGSYLKNGGRDYKIAHQDIFLAEAHEDAPQSIVVGDDIDGAAGSIWVWANSEYHYKQLTPFGKTASSTPSNTANYAVFRNAQPDSVTENETDQYLYGVQGSDGYVAWSGGVRMVVLQKVSAAQDYASMANAKFTLYKSNGTTVYQDNITSQSNGTITVGELPIGTYYLQETSPANRRFELVVPKEGDVTIRNV